MSIKLNEIEEEVVFLNAIEEMIGLMVNFGMLTLHGSDPNSSILFETSMHQRFFNIVLVDFLSCSDKKAPVNQRTYLGALKTILTQPKFDVDNSVASLRDATDTFVKWLAQEISVDVPLPSINTQTSIYISRLDSLKMCGNISKHNVLRSVGIAEEFQKKLLTSNISVELEDAMLALGDFYARFHTDILNYHSSTIAEFLNNIHWGIYEYLQPEFRRSIVWEEGNTRKYHSLPIGIKSNFAKQCYWNLMNDVRQQPYMQRFHVSKCLKQRY